MRAALRGSRHVAAPMTSKTPWASAEAPFPRNSGNSSSMSSARRASKGGAAPWAEVAAGLAHNRRLPPALGSEPARRLAVPAGGPRRCYCAAILLHCASASCLSEAIGIFAAAVRQACFAVLSAVFTFALPVVI